MMKRTREIGSQEKYQRLALDMAEALAINLFMPFSSRKASTARLTFFER